MQDVEPESTSHGVFAEETLATVAYLPFPRSASSGGVVNLGWRARREPTDDELAFYVSLVAILAEGVARAQSTELERLAIHAFQRALLPAEFPRSVQVAVRYEAALALDVGGDWYDVFALPGDKIGLAVGDVVGHGVDAAAQMGQLQSVLRAAATRGDEPGEVLDVLDQFASGGAGSLAATVCYAIVDLARREVRFSCAGHPPPLVAGREVRFADAGRSGPVGFGLESSGPRPVATVALEPEALVVMYTDGLVERRGRPIDAGLAALARSVSAAVDLPVEDLADAILADLRQPERRDDAALLCVRVPGSPPRHFAGRIVADPAQLRRVRVDLRGWLALRGVADDVIDDVVSAATEATSNAVDHAYQRDHVGQVGIDVVVDDAVRVTVRDRGQWVQPLRRPDRGREFAIMERLMDEVAVETSTEGTIVRLTKRRGAERDDGVRS